MIIEKRLVIRKKFIVELLRKQFIGFALSMMPTIILQKLLLKSTIVAVDGKKYLKRYMVICRNSKVI